MHRTDGPHLPGSGARNAHGIVHRDLKPSNVLVTPAGDPKVLDFGLARYTDPDALLQTKDGQLLGTLPYMAPERLEAGTSAAGLRGDVYSLGVMLYELLAGELPLSLASRSIPAAAQAILHEEARPLGQLKATLRGDVETIVSKALQKDPDRRYLSMQGLADDLDRFLRGEPILARPSSILYRSSKFAKRHRGLVSGLAVAFLTLSVSTIVAIVLAAQARADRKLAQAQVVRLRAVNSLFDEVLATVDPEASRLRLAKASDIKLVDALGGVAEGLHRAYQQQPKVEVVLRQRLSRAYATLGQHEEARAQLEMSLSLARAVHGLESPETVGLELAQIDLSDLKPTARGDAYQAMRERCERLFGAEHEHTLTSLNGVVTYLINVSRFAEALPLAEEARTRADRALDPHHDSRLRALNNLAFALKPSGDLESVEELFAEVVRIREETQGALHPATLRAKVNIVHAWRLQGRRVESIDLLEQVKDAQSKLFGPHSSAVNFTRNQLAFFHVELGQLERAIDLLEQNASAPGGDPNGLYRLNLTKFYNRAGCYEQALTLSTALVEHQRERFGEDSFELALAREARATSLAGIDRHPAAIELFEEALATVRSISGEDGRPQNRIRIGLSRSLIALGQFDAAETRLRAAYESTVRAVGTDHAQSRGRAKLLVELYGLWSRPEDVKTWLPRSEEAAPHDKPTHRN